MAGLAATVQVGDIAGSEQLLATIAAGDFDLHDGEMIVGDTERSTSVGLHRLQTGDVAGAMAGLDAMRARLAPAVDPNLQAAVALAHAVAGQLDDALTEADEVDHHERATYLDRITAGIARGLALTRQGERAAATAAFDQVQATADATEDRVSQALARLAGATAASALGEADAAVRSSEAEVRLAELGMQDTGWRQAFSVATGISPAT